MRTFFLVVALAGAGTWMAPAAAQEGLMAESPVDGGAAIDTGAGEELTGDPADDEAIQEAAEEEAAGDAKDDEAIAEAEAEEKGLSPNPAERASEEENAEPVEPREAAPPGSDDDGASAAPAAPADESALTEPVAPRDGDGVRDEPLAAAPTVVLETLTITEDTPSQVELTFSTRAQRPTAKAIGGEAGKPERIVIDFPSTKLGKTVPASSPGRGRVLQVRAGQYKPDVARVVLELAEPWPTRVRLKNDKVVIQLEDSSSASAR